MRIRLMQVLLVPVTALFCMVAFSSTLPDATQDQSFRTTGVTGNFFATTDQSGDPAWVDVAGDGEPVTQEPLLLAGKEKVYVCKTNKQNGHMETLYIPLDTYKKQAADNPNDYSLLLGKCEKKKSHS